VLLHPKLTDALNVDTSALGFTLDDVEYITDVTVTTGNIDSLRQNYDKFIYYQNWRITE
jgi:hypothetical protein